MSKKIVFLAGSCGRDIWMWKIYEEMNKKEHIIPYFIATREKNVNFLCSKGIKKEQIFDFFSIPENKHPDYEYIIECEKKYHFNIWDAWHVTAVRKKKRAKIDEKIILGYFQFFFRSVEHIIKEFNPDYYICYGPAGYHTMIIHEVFRQNNIPVVELVASLISNRFTVTNDLSYDWPLVSAAYNKIKEEGLNKEEERQASTFLEEFINKPNTLRCPKNMKEKYYIKIKRNLFYIYEIIRYDQKLPPSLRFLFWPLIEKTYDLTGIFDQPKKGEKYVLFPLHYQPEATTLIYGKWYVDQASLIENISKSLPVTHKLYVKEHHTGYGNRDFNFYRRIKKLSNIRLISPHCNNFNLIKQSSLLITITGTSGWEALLFQIPVITFGNVFYNCFTGVSKIKEIEKLPEEVRKKIDKKIERNHILNAITALNKGTYPGIAWLPTDCQEITLNKNNIKLLVSGIENYISKIRLINKS